jgi:hypothetical protein
MPPTTRPELANRRRHQPRWAFLWLLFRRRRFTNRQRLLPLSALRQQARCKRWLPRPQAAVAGRFRLAHFAVRRSRVRRPPAFTMRYPIYSPPLRSNFSRPHPLAAQLFTGRASAICLQPLPARLAPDWRRPSDPALLWARGRRRSPYSGTSGRSFRTCRLGNSMSTMPGGRTSRECPRARSCLLEHREARITQRHEFIALASRLLRAGR